MKKMSKGAIGGIIAAAVVLITVIVLIIVEACMGGHLYIENNMLTDIENFDISFYDDYGEQTVDVLFSDPVKAGDKLKFDYGEAFDFTGTETECVMSVKIAGGEEIIIFDGYFTSVYSGNFDFKFTEDADGMYLAAKAASGLFGSVSASELDEKYILFPEIGDYDYADWYLEGGFDEDEFDEYEYDEDEVLYIDEDEEDF